MLEITKGEGKFHVCAQIAPMGNGLSVAITGGEVPHLGAVALGIPRPSLMNPEKISASVSVLTITGHKEDEVCRSVAAKLSAGLNMPVVVSAGIHIDNILADEILKFKEYIEQLTDEICSVLKR